MKRLNLKHSTTQFFIELCYGIALLSPLAFAWFTGHYSQTLLFIGGVSVGYVLHVIQRVLLFEEMLSEVDDRVEDRVEETVPKATKEEVRERTKKEVQKEVEEAVPKKVEEEVNGSD